jgi:hypothetical protein
MSFLNQDRTTESYFTKIQTKSRSFKQGTKSSLVYFNNFTLDQYLKDSKTVIAEINKLGGTTKERVTFLSKEASQYVLPLLEKKKFDDLVFVKNEDSFHAVLNEEIYFGKLRKRVD